MYLLFTWNVKGFLQCISYYKCFNLYYRCILLYNIRILRNEFIMQYHMTWISRILLVVCINVFFQLCVLLWQDLMWDYISQLSVNSKGKCESRYSAKINIKEKFKKTLFYSILLISICLNHPMRWFPFGYCYFIFFCTGFSKSSVQFSSISETCPSERLRGLCVCVCVSNYFLE